MLTLRLFSTISFDFIFRKPILATRLVRIPGPLIRILSVAKKEHSRKLHKPDLCDANWDRSSTSVHHLHGY
jgi:hypothetical protein